MIIMVTSICTEIAQNRVKNDHTLQSIRSFIGMTVVMFICTEISQNPVKNDKTQHSLQNFVLNQKIRTSF